MNSISNIAVNNRQIYRKGLYNIMSTIYCNMCLLQYSKQIRCLIQN